MQNQSTNSSGQKWRRDSSRRLSFSKQPQQTQLINPNYGGGLDVFNFQHNKINTTVQPCQRSRSKGNLGSRPFNLQMVSNSTISNCDKRLNGNIVNFNQMASNVLNFAKPDHLFSKSVERQTNFTQSSQTTLALTQKSCQNSCRTSNQEAQINFEVKSQQEYQQRDYCYPPSEENSFNQLAIHLDNIMINDIENQQLNSSSLNALSRIQKSQQQLDKQATYAKKIGDQQQLDLEKKVKELEAKILFLDNYRIVCEKRILDFDNQHPLPVLPSHIKSNQERGKSQTMMRRNEQNSSLVADEFTLGANSPANLNQLSTMMACQSQSFNQQIQDTQDSQVEAETAYLQKISHELQIAKNIIDQISQERESLVETLRQETLINEEQRAQIQALQASLQDKLHNINLDKFLVSMMGEKQSLNNSGITDSYLLISEMKKQLDQMCKELNETTQNLQQSQHTQEKLQLENQKLQGLTQSQSKEIKSLESLIMSSKKSYDEIKLLFEQGEQDKNSLMDCFEENNKQIELCNRQLEEERVKVDELNQAKGLYKQLYQEISEKVDTLNKELDGQKERNKELQDLSKHKEVATSELKLKIQELEQDNENIKTQLEENKQTLEEFILKDKNWQQVITSKNQENRSLHYSVKTLTDQLTIRRQECQSNRLMIDELEQSYQKMSMEYENKIVDLVSENDKIVEELKSQILKLSTESGNQIDIMKQRLSIQESQIKRLENETDEKESNFLNVTADNVYLKNMVSNLEEENETLRAENENLRAQISKLNQSNESRNLEVVSLKEQFDNFKTDLIFKTNQIEILEQKICQQQIDMETLNNELTRDKQEIKTLVQQNECLKSEKQQLMDEKCKTENQLILCLNNLKNIETEVQILKSEKQMYEQLEEDLKDYEEKERQINIKCESLESMNSDFIKEITHLKQVLLDEEREKQSIKLQISDYQSQLCKTEKLLSEAELREAEEAQRCKHIEEQLQETSRRGYEQLQTIQELSSKYEQANQERQFLKDVNDGFVERVKKMESEKQQLAKIIQENESNKNVQDALQEKIRLMVKEIIGYLSQVQDQSQDFKVTYVKQDGQIIPEIICLLSEDEVNTVSQILKNCQNISHQDQETDTLESAQSQIKDFRNLMSVWSLLSQKVLLEYCQCLGDIKVMEEQIVALEKRLSTISANEVFQTERHHQISNELNELSQQRNITLNELKQAQTCLSNQVMQNKQLEQQVSYLQRVLKDSQFNNHNTSEQYSHSQELIDQLEIKEQIIQLQSQELKENNSIISKIIQQAFSNNPSIIQETNYLISQQENKFREEKSKLNLEIQILSFEAKLQNLLNSNDHESQYFEAQEIKQQLNEIESLIQESENKIENLSHIQQSKLNDLMLIMEQSISQQNISLGSQMESSAIGNQREEIQKLHDELQLKNSIILDLQNQLIVSRSIINYSPQMLMNGSNCIQELMGQSHGSSLVQTSLSQSMNDSLKSLHQHITQQDEVIKTKPAPLQVQKTDIKVLQSNPNIINESVQNSTQGKIKIPVIAKESIRSNYSRKMNQENSNEIISQQKNLKLNIQNLQNLEKQQQRNNPSAGTRLTGNQILKQSYKQAESSNSNHQTSVQSSIYQQDTQNMSQNQNQFKRINLRELIPSDSVETNLNHYLRQGSEFTASTDSLNHQTGETQVAQRNNNIIYEANQL